MRTLKELVEATPALRKARKSADPEVRRRVEEILKALERKRALHALSKCKALGKEGRFVEIADRLAFAARCGVPADEGWESLMLAVDRLSRDTERYFAPSTTFHSNPYFPAGDYRRYLRHAKAKEIAERKIQIDTGDGKPIDPKGIAAHLFIKEHGATFLLRGEEVSVIGRHPPVKLQGGIIAASGDVQVCGAMDSVIIAGADVKRLTFLCGCIVICDGDVKLTGQPTGGKSLIVVRGEVTLTQGQLRNCVVRSGQTLRLLDGKTIDLKEGTSEPIAFVKFFELADVGLTAEDLPEHEKSNADGALLKEVRKGSPFAGGLRAGDVITAVEDKKTPTTEIFRRVLRRKLAEGGPNITFSIRRGKETRDVDIPVKD
jgi:hypothetical protein